MAETIRFTDSVARALDEDAEIRLGRDPIYFIHKKVMEASIEMLNLKDSTGDRLVINWGLRLEVLPRWWIWNMCKHNMKLRVACKGIEAAYSWCEVRWCRKLLKETGEQDRLNLSFYECQRRKGCINIAQISIEPLVSDLSAKLHTHEVWGFKDLDTMWTRGKGSTHTHVWL